MTISQEALPLPTMPGSDLVAGAALLRLLDFPRLQRDRGRHMTRRPSRRSHAVTRRHAHKKTASNAVFAHARALIEPALKAPDAQALKQALGEIGLSVSYAELEIEIVRFVSEARLNTGEPFELSEETQKRIGPTASALVAKSVMLYDEAISSYGVDKFASEIEALKNTKPEELSKIRRFLVLGDVVHPDVSSMILRGLRGSISLVGVAEISAEHPEWMMIALGQSALDGALAISQLVSADLDKEAYDYAAWKASVFLRLENGEVVDVDER